MTPAEILAHAAQRGFTVRLDPDGVRLRFAPGAPPDLVDLLRTNKPELVAYLQTRQEFEDHVANVMQVRGLPRPDAERVAYAIVLTGFLNRTHPNTPSDVCARCGQPGDLRPIGWGERHAWVHDTCWRPWNDERQAGAEQELAGMGIARPPPAKPAAIDHRIRAKIIDWDRSFCLHCRARVLAGQPWTDVAGTDGEMARFHNDCLVAWIIINSKGISP